MWNEAQLSLFPAAPLNRWQAAATPIAIATLLAGVRNLAIVVPHPDDETLGCGGLIAAAAALGVAVTVTILTDGSASHPGSSDWPPRRLARLRLRLARQRRREARIAVSTLTGGTGRTVFAEAPDGALAAHPDTADAIPAADMIVTCWHGDPHADHVAAFAIAETVARRWGVPLLAFPLWVLTTDRPVAELPIHRIDITTALPCKRLALAAHASQLGGVVDDVQGFTLDAELLGLFVRADELFVRVI